MSIVKTTRASIIKIGNWRIWWPREIPKSRCRFVRQTHCTLIAASQAQPPTVLKLGNGFEAGVAQVPLVEDSAVAKVEQYRQDAVARDARLVTGGKRLQGRFFEPTVTTGMWVALEYLCLGNMRKQSLSDAAFRIPRYRLGRAASHRVPKFVVTPRIRTPMDSGKTMSNIQRLRLPENDPTFGGNKVFDLFQYSPAVKAGGLVFIAGQVGIRPD
ncbi:MAG: aldehyde dehydrogenase family protein, partial [Burkholderiaceae bacterium]|nr:aldehyde dehydrogenase family protein [Burkholderiaceae bacterium]